MPLAQRVQTGTSSRPGPPWSRTTSATRTTAMLLKDLGVSAGAAQMILGHAEVAATLGIYSEVFDTEIASALSRVNDELDRRHHDTHDDTDTAVEGSRHARPSARVVVKTCGQTPPPKIARGR